VSYTGELQEPTKRFVEAEREAGPSWISHITGEVERLGLEDPEGRVEQQRLYDDILAYAKAREGGTLKPGEGKPGFVRIPRKRLTGEEAALVDEMAAAGHDVPAIRREFTRRGWTDGVHWKSVYDAIYARVERSSDGPHNRQAPEPVEDDRGRAVWLRDELILCPRPLSA
jgi:hypothetical protein